MALPALVGDDVDLAKGLELAVSAPTDLAPGRQVVGQTRRMGNRQLASREQGGDGEGTGQQILSIRQVFECLPRCKVFPETGSVIDSVAPDPGGALCPHGHLANWESHDAGTDSFARSPQSPAGAAVRFRA